MRLFEAGGIDGSDGLMALAGVRGRRRGSKLQPDPRVRRGDDQGQKADRDLPEEIVRVSRQERVEEAVAGCWVVKGWFLNGSSEGVV